jgi:hypothetical protein
MGLTLEHGGSRWRPVPLLDPTGADSAWPTRDDYAVDRERFLAPHADTILQLLGKLLNITTITTP